MSTEVETSLRHCEEVKPTKQSRVQSLNFAAAPTGGECYFRNALWIAALHFVSLAMTFDYQLNMFFAVSDSFNFFSCVRPAFQTKTVGE